MDLTDGILDCPDKSERPAEFACEQLGETHEYLQIVQQVYNSGLHNYDGLRININKRWNVQLIDSLLSEYHDREIVRFLQYGWPVDRDDSVLEMGGLNHKGATEYSDHIDEYVSTELSLDAATGPFDSIPFESHTRVAISPLSTRPKKDSPKRRIIMDCSWPVGASLNDGLNKYMYLGKTIVLTYPNVDSLARRVYDLSLSDNDESIYFFKEDLEQAFRQLLCCPGSVPLLGYRWRQKYYFDKVMVMGCTIAPYICQRTTNMIAYIHHSAGYHLLNYVDDFLGAEHKTKAFASKKAFITLLNAIGADRAKAKSAGPSQEIEFIGTLFNSSNMTIGITDSRKAQVLAELENWRWRKYTTRKQMESLIGKLQFLSNCV